MFLQHRKKNKMKYSKKEKTSKQSIFTVENCRKSKISRHGPLFAIIKDSKQLLRYGEEAMESESYSYECDINEKILFLWSFRVRYLTLVSFNNLVFKIKVIFWDFILYFLGRRYFTDCIDFKRWKFALLFSKHGIMTS